MRRHVAVLTLLAMPLAPVSPAAGEYDGLVQPIAPSSSVAEFVNQLKELRGYAPPDMQTMTEPTRLRVAALFDVQSLRMKESLVGLSVEEEAALGALLVRLIRDSHFVALGPLRLEVGGLGGRVWPNYDEAITVLRAALRRADESHATYYYLNATLGTLWMHTGELDAAIGALQQAEITARRLQRPDSVYIKHHLKLAQLRKQEREQHGDRFRGREPLDKLFEAIFLGPRGVWEVGTLAPEQAAKLPGGSIDDAIRIVQQLLIALPEDARLHWLLGELANAKGDAKGAHAAMRVAVEDLRLSNPLLLQHRQVLDLYLAWQEMFTRYADLTRGGASARKTEETKLDPKNGALLLLSLLGNGTLAATPGSVGPSLTNIAAAMPPPTEPPVPELTEETYDVFARFGWKAWAVIAVGSMVVLGLLFVQLRQYARRWTAKGRRQPIPPSASRTP